MAKFKPHSVTIELGTGGFDNIFGALASATKLTRKGIEETWMGGLDFTVARGNIVKIDYTYQGELSLSLSDISISFKKMKAAFAAFAEDPVNYNPFLELFSGIDYTADFAKLKSAVSMYGIGGDDTFTLTRFDDEVRLDGGKDRIRLGAGDDIAYVGASLFGAPGKSTVDGGRGFDTISLSYITDIGQNVDLSKTVTFKTADGEFKVDFTGFEQIGGTIRADRVLGTDVAEWIYGGLGNDKLTGRGGADTLIGGEGADTFVYLAAKDSGRGARADTITDFEVGIDLINLAALHPRTGDDRFVFIGEDAFSGQAGQLRFERLDGDDAFTLVQADLDGDGTTDLEIKLTGLVELSGGDFVL